MFDYTTFLSTNYYELKYQYDELDTSFKNYFGINYTGNVSFEKNQYISNHTTLIKKESDIDPSNYLIHNETLNQFYFKRDTSSQIPKVFISLNLLHPYLRPMNSNPRQKDCYFFQILEMFTAIRRKILFDLSDAVRAENEINFQVDQNYLIINVYSFEDVVYKIIEKIKYIILDYKWDESDFVILNEMYKDETFDEYLSFNENGQINLNDIPDIAQYYFYCNVQNGLYNKYEFLKSSFNYTDCINQNFNVTYLQNFLVVGYIHGYYNKIQAENLSSLFDRNGKEEEDLNNFEACLTKVNNTIINNTQDFPIWIKEINSLDVAGRNNVTILPYIINKNYFNVGYRYTLMSKYSEENYIKNSLLSIMLSKNIIEYNITSAYFSLFAYNKLFFQLELYIDSDTTSNPNEEQNVKNVIESAINITRKTFQEIVDDLGDKFYYIKKNYIMTLTDTQSSLDKKAAENMKYLLYAPGLQKDFRDEEERNDFIYNIDLEELIKEFKDEISTHSYFDVLTANVNYPIFK